MRLKHHSLWAGPAALVGVAMVVFSVLAWAGTAPAQNSPAQAKSAQAKSTPAPAAATQPISTNTAFIQQGELLYNEHCASCHGIGAVGSKGPELLNVGAAAVDFFLSTGRMPLASPNLEPVSSWPYFNPTQIKQIIAYINALEVENGSPGPGIPVVTPACNSGDNCPTLSEGNALFLLNCAQCHDASGSGGELSHGYLVPSLRAATPTEIAEAIRVGPRPMPEWGPGQLTNQQVSSIADYIQYITAHPDPGGLGIAHFGPVPEGFVGIVFGLGLLLVVARVIGNRG